MFLFGLISMIPGKKMFFLLTKTHSFQNTFQTELIFIRGVLVEKKKISYLKIPKLFFSLKKNSKIFSHVCFMNLITAKECNNYIYWKGGGECMHTRPYYLRPLVPL